MDGLGTPYVTQHELDLALKAIQIGSIPEQEKDVGLLLLGSRTYYGLAWLGYEYQYN